MAKSKKTPAKHKLPFLVQPRLDPIVEVIGNDLTGQIEIKRQGYLSVGEKAYMANVESSDESVPKLMSLSRKVAKHYEIDINKAYTLVVANATNQPADTDLRPEFDEELAEVLSALVASEQRKSIMKAYCLLLYRLDAEVELDDVINLNPALLEELVELYDDEEQKSIDRLTVHAEAGQDREAIENVSKK